MEAEAARALAHGCTALSICEYRIEVLAGAALLAVLVMTALHLLKRRRSRLQETARNAQQAQERRQELLHKLTFFFPPLRHIYNKFPAERLPQALQAERQAFLEA